MQHTANTGRIHAEPNVHHTLALGPRLSAARTATPVTSHSLALVLTPSRALQAVVKRHNYNVDYPIRHGIVENWDNMEKYWQRCLYQYLCCDPEEHHMLLVRALLLLLYYY